MAPDELSQAARLLQAEFPEIPFSAIEAALKACDLDLPAARRRLYEQAEQLASSQQPGGVEVRAGRLWEPLEAALEPAGARGGLPRARRRRPSAAVCRWLAVRVAGRRAGCSHSLPPPRAGGTAGQPRDGLELGGAPKGVRRRRRKRWMLCGSRQWGPCVPADNNRFSACCRAILPLLSCTPPCSPQSMRDMGLESLGAQLSLLGRQVAQAVGDILPPELNPFGPDEEELEEEEMRAAARCAVCFALTPWGCAAVGAACRAAWQHVPLCPCWPALLCPPARPPACTLRCVTPRRSRCRRAAHEAAVEAETAAVAGGAERKLQSRRHGGGTATAAAPQQRGFSPEPEEEYWSDEVDDDKLD